jgi:hypothetical protein
MRIEGKLIQAGEPTLNGRIYSKEALERIVEDVQDKVKSRSLIGRVGTNQETRISLSEASHVVTNLEMGEKEMVMDIEILDTPKGEELRALIDSKTPLTIHPMFMGTVENGEVSMVDLKLLSADVCPLDEVDNA